MPNSSPPAPEFEIPVGPQSPMPLPKWAEGDASAVQEEKEWDALEQTRFNNDRRWLTHYGWIIVVLTWVFALAFIGALVVWVVHHLAPSTCVWLDEPRLSKIQAFLFSGGMGAVVSGMVRAQVGKAQ